MASAHSESEKIRFRAMCDVRQICACIATANNGYALLTTLDCELINDPVLR